MRAVTVAGRTAPVEGGPVRHAPEQALLTAKGQRTKAKILASARRVLEDKGYFEAAVNDITSDSGVALGTFYRYFSNKEEAFMVLLEKLVEDLYESTGGSWNDGDRLGSLVEASRRYLTAYEANRMLIAALLQMAAASPECAAAWSDLRRRTHRRMATYSPQTHYGPEGGLAIAALATMVESSAYRWFIEARGDEVPSVARAAETLGRIWHRALYSIAE
jgi:AcrR family transcriptional regulator